MGNHHKTLGLRSLRFPGKEPAHNAKKISPAKNLPSSSTQPKSRKQSHEASRNFTKPHQANNSQSSERLAAC